MAESRQSLSQRCIRALIRGYQIVFSPWLGANCRFQPTCSQYGLEAVARHGTAKGSWLLLKRIARCHPWGGQGFDPVPEPSAEQE